ncbi:hypothetical protein M8C21_023323 [Ambrosia artemisiifolia]|uniref:Uncharacterized protein n=1 Tax=Ambrosia artemisiifolia TaxID=4212 RepID=A0AAD5CZF5_AMBAR|nr:hypothetical protein M8C21_023323 [Ambrosia artemisiifolia]
MVAADAFRGVSSPLASAWIAFPRISIRHPGCQRMPTNHELKVFRRTYHPDIKRKPAAEQKFKKIAAQLVGVEQKKTLVQEARNLRVAR